MPGNLLKEFRVLLTSIGLAICFSLITSCATHESEETKRQDKIMRHCKLMYVFGKSYSEYRAEGLNRIEARDKATRLLVAKYSIKAPLEKVESINDIATVFVELLEPRQPSTMGYFVSSNCMFTHAKQKFLPLDSKAGRAQINHVLKSCEETSKSDDDLGACVITDLAPLVR